MVIVAAALAWFGAGCSSTAEADHRASNPTRLRRSGDAGRRDGHRGANRRRATARLTTSYTYGWNGGDVAADRRERLDGPRVVQPHHDLSAAPSRPRRKSCTPALPACGDVTRIDAGDIVRDLANPDVLQAMAMATAPLYGLDQRPIDGADVPGIARRRPRIPRGCRLRHRRVLPRPRPGRHRAPGGRSESAGSTTARRSELRLTESAVTTRLGRGASMHTRAGAVRHSATRRTLRGGERERARGEICAADLAGRQARARWHGRCLLIRAPTHRRVRTPIRRHR